MSIASLLSAHPNVESISFLRVPLFLNHSDDDWEIPENASEYEAIVLAIKNGSSVLMRRNEKCKCYPKGKGRSYEEILALIKNTSSSKMREIILIKYV